MVSTKFLEQYFQRMKVSLSGNMSGYPTMLQYPDMPTMPVWLEQGVEEQGDDEEEEDDDDDDGEDMEE